MYARYQACRFHCRSLLSRPPHTAHGSAVLHDEERRHLHDGWLSTGVSRQGCRLCHSGACSLQVSTKPLHAHTVYSLHPPLFLKVRMQVFSFITQCRQHNGAIVPQFLERARNDYSMRWHVGNILFIGNCSNPASKAMRLSRVKCVNEQAF